MSDQDINELAGLTSEERANRIKAIDITIDSLKQYITLSTVAIAGLLAYYNGNGKNGIMWLFVVAVIGFILCAIISIWTINTFINKVHNHIIDTRHDGLRGLNFTAIILFLVGVSFSAIFFFSSHKEINETNSTDSKIIINEKSIEIGKDVKTKVIITTDTLIHSKIIRIN